MSGHHESRSVTLCVYPSECVTLNAGDLRQILSDRVTPHPKDDRYLFSAHLGADDVPPTAEVTLHDDYVQFEWTERDIAAYRTAVDIERTERDLRNTERAAAEASGGASDTV